MRNDTHNKVTAMHDALMAPQFGQGNKSLLERIATVTVEIESGKRTADGLLYVAKWMVGVAAAVAILVASMRWGSPRN